MYVHRHIWKLHNGEIPKGMDIHHKDHNPFNNDISNLELIDQLKHHRLHAGYKLKKGIWWKKCNKCGKWKS